MRSLILLPILSVIAFSCALVARAAPDAYGFDSWTTDNGLPQNGIRGLGQTPDGYLWFTTFDGLVRFDGVRFTTFNKSNTPGIINNRFSYLFIDIDGTIYATTTEDGVLTIGRNGTFRSFTSDQVPGHYIQKIKRGPDGELIFLSEDESRTSKTWYFLRNNEFVPFERNAPYDAPIEVVAGDGSKWIVGRKVTTHLTGSETVDYPLDLSKVPFAPHTFIDREGALWIGEMRAHRLKDGKVETLSEAVGLPTDSIVHSFWEEADGSLWFATGGGTTGGVGLVRRKNGQIEFFNKSRGLSSNSIANLFHDREGNVWLATDKGLNRLRKRVVTPLSAEQGLVNSEVYPMIRDRSGVIWVGTHKGLSVYRNGRFEPVTFKSDGGTLATEAGWVDGRISIQSLFEDSKGRLWVGLNGGIFVAENGAGHLIDETIASHVFAIKEDGDGFIWAATNKGLMRFKDCKFERLFDTDDGLPNEFMTEIFQDSKGLLWFGGFGGLSEYKDGGFTNYTSRQGLAGNYVRTIYEDSEGTMWIGTYEEGLSRFKNGRFSTINSSHGLYNNGVFAIREDRRGNFWISSNNGIYRVSKRELNDFADGLVRSINSTGYGKDDGMLSTECNGGRQPSSLVDEDGRFWFPTQAGIAVVDPETDNVVSGPPTVVIEKVTIGREPTPYINGLNIEPGSRNIEFSYTGISLVRSEQIRFKYRLEGHDPDWVDAGTRRTAHYSYLPPGTYHFRVIAANSEGVWSAEGAVIEVVQEPFFYDTWTFYGLCALLVVLTIAGVWRLSIIELRRRERRLTRLVAERTDELRQVNQELEHLANSDGLTKIGNRRRFERFLADEWHRAVRFRTEISIVLLDIDHFKLYNDTYGHQTGDECLQRVAEALAEAIHRPSDLVARFGGEEFAIILGGTDAAGAYKIAQTAIGNVNQLFIPHLSSSTSEYLTISAGIATILPQVALSEADLIRAADNALYDAKRLGRNRIIVNDLSMTPAIPAILEAQVLIDR